jgi:hypothetical protein
LGRESEIRRKKKEVPFHVRNTTGGQSAVFSLRCLNAKQCAAERVADAAGGRVV